MTQKKVIPHWYSEPPPAGSFRSLFKWGDPGGFKHPNSGLVRLMMETFHLTEDELQEPVHLGLESLCPEIPSALEPRHLEFFREICGTENVHLDTYTRVSRSYGGGMIDACACEGRSSKTCHRLCLRHAQAGIEKSSFTVIARISRSISMALVHLSPRNGSVKGGISLDMSRHMNRVVDFNEVDQTITVEAGMTGPQLEELLNQAPETLGAQRRYYLRAFSSIF